MYITISNSQNDYSPFLTRGLFRSSFPLSFSLTIRKKSPVKSLDVILGPRRTSSMQVFSRLYFVAMAAVCFNWLVVSRSAMHMASSTLCVPTVSSSSQSAGSSPVVVGQPCATEVAVVLSEEWVTCFFTRIRMWWRRWSQFVIRACTLLCCIGGWHRYESRVFSSTPALFTEIVIKYFQNLITVLVKRFVGGPTCKWRVVTTWYRQNKCYLVPGNRWAQCLTNIRFNRVRSIYGIGFNHTTHHVLTFSRWPVSSWLMVHI